MKLVSKILLVLLVSAVQVFAGGAREGSVRNFELLGAGASFPAPLMTAWADEYRDLTNGRVTINYQSIGSGGGIRQFLEQTIMFGATESALTDDHMVAVRNQTDGLAFNLPLTLGDVVITYNLPGIEKGLVFSSDVIAGAFLGHITNWNDPRIASLNPGVSLPNLPISIAHRSDGSGTTAVFTSYLSKVSSQWARSVGTGTSVNWPVGTGGNGNEGVAGIVMNTPGAMGYNSLVYAVLNEIGYGSVINKSGNIIVPSLEATSLSAAVSIPKDGRVMLTDTDAALGYPIAGFAWSLVYENLDRNTAIPDRETAAEVVKFLYWVITEGQSFNESLSFARLPEDAQNVAVQMVGSLKWKGEALGREVIADVTANGF